MEELSLKVKGSSADPYELTFIKDGASLTALCTCPAGTFGNLCKHRVAVLDGESATVLDEDKEKVATAASWLAGSDVESALLSLRAIPKSDKDAIGLAKRALAKAMNS